MNEFNDEYTRSVGKSALRRTWIRVDLLNDNYIKLDSLECDIISGSITIQNALDSDLARRKGNLVLASRKDLNEDFYKITLKNCVQIYIGIENIALKQQYEFNMGIYLLNSPNTKISVSERTITLDLCDLIENYSRFSNGLVGKLSFGADANLAETILNIATNSNLMGLSSDKTLIESCDSLIDSAQTFEQDTDLVDVLKKLISLHPIYDCYFNNGGYFVFELIKQRATDSAIDYIDNDFPSLISIDYKKNWENVRNDIIVNGAMISNDDGTTTQAKYELRNETGNELSIDKLGLHRKVISNDNNKTDAMCQSEAIYWMDKYSNFAETLTLQMIPAPYLVPNKVIEVNLEYEDIIITGRWLIDSISIDLKFDGLQTVTCHKLYGQAVHNLDGSLFSDTRSGIVADGGSFTSTQTNNVYDGGSY
ncbi:hypothetical protein [Clostridium beijerinckii]|jgi:hypothetical protein|uniref:Uncharacterized protein n=2 Tax=Clostridium beijerinckii TaxID=1520 RepID=A0AAE2V408_CLOBE|nr:hypothetical protein [Clostridium beijerinckii]ABR33545.1 hypothetical protein Cbei_1365 [Clostridium beijerinckii NCIMB 8052]AIU04861.1 hypothetical protein Cbs_1365 [Clostridium beijerinckii ATCC 35702]MBF7811961.1 hypothetical protein [Clostridium beijerinckii]NRT25188.1 hypothetical protein [Clostridium beijerinckii]NRT67218.1 hypothetical protein [Clostridium beijerinckii]